MPKLVTKRAAIGVLQGSIVSVLSVSPETQVIVVQNVSLLHTPKRSDEPATIVSKAVHVSSDCCCIAATDGIPE